MKNCNNAAAKPFVFGLEQRFIRLPFSRSPLGSIKNKKKRYTVTTVILSEENDEKDWSRCIAFGFCAYACNKLCYAHKG